MKSCDLVIMIQNGNIPFYQANMEELNNTIKELNHLFQFSHQNKNAKRMVMYYRKILVVSLSETKEQIFQQIVEWLSSILTSSPTFMKQTANGFHLDPFTRTFNNENGNIVYLTAKEFDFIHKEVKKEDRTRPKQSAIHYYSLGYRL